MRSPALLPLYGFLLASLAWGQADPPIGDFNGDGIAGPEDLLELLQGFGQPVSGGSGDLLWARRAFSPSFDGANDIALDSNGRVIVVGSYGSGAIFGEGEPTQTTLTSPSGSHSYIAQYTSDGGFVRVRTSSNSASGSEVANGVAVRQTDNAIWTTGNFVNTATFGIGGTTPLMVTSGGSTDIFLSRSSTDGEIETLQKSGGAEFQEGFAVDVLPDGTHIQVGVMDLGATFGEGGSAISLTASSSRNIFVVKYNPDGTPAWGKTIAATLFNSLVDGKLLPDGRVVIAGTFDDPLTLGMGEPNEITLDPIQSDGGFDSDDAFVALFNSDGSLAWAKSDGGTGEDGSAGVTVLPNSGGFIYCGRFEGVATFGAGTASERILTSDGGTDIFVAKYNLSGELQWARRAGGEGASQGFEVAATPDGGAVMIGTFQGTCTFGIGEPNETSLVADANTDSFVAKFESQGGLLWAKRLGGPGNVFARGVDVGSDGASVVVGDFSQTLTLGEDEPGEIILESGGTPTITSIFVAKFAP